MPADPPQPGPDDAPHGDDPDVDDGVVVYADFGQEPDPDALVGARHRHPTGRPPAG